MSQRLMTRSVIRDDLVTYALCASGRTVIDKGALWVAGHSPSFGGVLWFAFPLWCRDPAVLALSINNYQLQQLIEQASSLATNQRKRLNTLIQLAQQVCAFACTSTHPSGPFIPAPHVPGVVECWAARAHSFSCLQYRRARVDTQRPAWPLHLQEVL